MILALVLMVAQAPAKTALEPLAALKQIIAHYQGLKNIRYTVIHHEGSGDKEKQTADRVYWSAPDHFEIQAIAYGPFPAALQPNLVSDGGIVESLGLLGGPDGGPLLPADNTVGPWEKRGGLPLVWMMNGKSWKEMSEPPVGGGISYAFGSTVTWHDHEAKQIVQISKTAAETNAVVFYVSPKYDALLGMEVAVGEDAPWIEFADVEENAK
ncbi:MAG TPA: hypothetical protein VG944_23425 [Fimbriimonas sp.]|nr:hypothetical protein [Fimbriimonas sp.]